MAISETNIANAALRLVGGGRISNRTDGSKNANVVDDLYDIVRDGLLRAHTWHCATRLIKLARLTTAPVFEYDYAYALPSNWLRTISLHDNDAGLGAVAYREAEIANVGALICSIEDAYLKYIYALTDPNRMPADLRTALITALARDMAIPVGKSNQLHETLAIRAQRDLNRAKSSDSLGSPSDQRPVGTWVTSRQSWPSTRWPR